MSAWLFKLAKQYDKMRLEHATEQKVIILDIDGTILDIRHAVFHMLRQYDQRHGTEFFQNLTPSHLHTAGNAIASFLKKRRIPRKFQKSIMGTILETLYNDVAIHQHNQPHPGIFEIIRWFQMQPSTRVVLISGRCESQRATTLLTLNTLGEPYRVYFKPDMLFMRPNDWAGSVAMYKVEAVHQLQKRGFQVVAMIDSEPENLAAIDAAETIKPIFLMHSETLRFSDPLLLPRQIVSGSQYNIESMVPNHELNTQAQLVWSGIQTHDDLLLYLVSDIEWAQLDIYPGMYREDLALTANKSGGPPLQPPSRQFCLNEALHMLKTIDRSIKFNLHIEGSHIAHLLKLLSRHDFSADKLWFDVHLDMLGPFWIQQITHAFPEAIIQSPIGNHMSLLHSPVEFKSHLNKAEAWGVNRYSLTYCQSNFRNTFLELSKLGVEVNIDGITNRQNFLQATLLEPTSITAAFGLMNVH